MKTSVKEGDADPVVTNQLVSATLAKADENYTTTLTAGKNSYTLTFTNVTTIDLLDVTDQNDIVVALTKDNFISFGYMATSTQNWNENKTYGDYKGDFYNMSSTDRNISIKVKGATSFEVFVQNTNTGRGYTIKVGEGEAQTINHGAIGIEESGIIKCGEEETTITIAGTGSSVYPVYILFNPTPAADSAAVTFDASLTDGSKYYATFSAEHALDFTEVEGVKAYVVTSYTYDGWSTFYANVQEVTKVPANTGVLLVGDNPTPTTYTIPFTDETVELEAENKLLVLEEATSAGNLGYPYTLAYAMGTALFQSAYGNLSAGTVYLSLTEDEDYDAYGYVVPKFASDGPDEPGEVLAIENIAALKAIEESSTVELTLKDAVVTQSKYDEDNFIDAIVIEDASGALRLTNQQLSTVLQVGQTLNGKITVTVNVTDYSSFGLGVYYNYVISDASITSIAYAAYGIPGDVTITDGTAEPKAITDETIYEWMYDYDWRYVSLANVSFTTQNEVGGNGVITIEDLGLDITVLDADLMITEWPADGSIVTVEEFLCDYIGGSVDYIFQPTKITVATPTTVAVTVGEDGYATFSCDKALDFTDSGIKAYVAVLDGKNITFSEVLQVPANTGVLLYAEGGAEEDVKIIDGGDLEVDDNSLVPSTADMDGTSLAGCYILSKVNGQIGFYKASTNATLAAGKAYFPSAVDGARIILPGQEATSIRSIETAEKDAEIYNLQGQRVKKAAKGLNIINGHKVIIR